LVDLIAGETTIKGHEIRLFSSPHGSSVVLPLYILIFFGTPT